jgi:hypothetical protein
MLAPLVVILGALALSEGTDRVATQIEARIGDDLDRVFMTVKTAYTPAEAVEAVSIVLAAERLRRPPKGMRPSEEREVFRGGHAFGGFERLRVLIHGIECRAEAKTLEDGTALLSCPLDVAAGETVAVAIEAELAVPDRYGEVGRRQRQVTLAGGWYPYVARWGHAPPHGPHAIQLELPSGYGAVVGRRWFPAPGDRDASTRRIVAEEGDSWSVPLVVLPPSAGRAAIGDGRAIFVATPGRRVHDPKTRSEKNEQIVETLEDGLRFWEEQGLPLPSASAPLVVVEAPLRHVLALATDGAVLVSDRAFRMVPIARLYRFHRFPILREVYAELFLDRMRGRELAYVTADAAAAFLVDRYVEERFERRDNAFDVLGWFSFIPSIDNLLYAPDLPFENAYFRRIKEDDPLRSNPIDESEALPRGKIVYEKLLDRLGKASTERVFRRILAGDRLEAAIERELGGETREFLATWLRPYPKVQYRIERWGSEPAGACPKNPCWRASVEIARTGEAVKEPIEVLLRDDAGAERRVWSSATADPMRTVTATLSAPLVFVEIDPNDRIAEAPTDETPSPRFDNRSKPAWKFLLNNWNISLAATAGTIDTALDVGILRVYDVRWAYAIRASYDPSAIALQGRASYGFGERVTPADLAQRVGVVLSGEYLRPNFGISNESALGISAVLYYAFDTRQTVWAPEGGQGLRASLQYNHTFGQVTELDASGTPHALSQDSAALTVRAFQAWRLGAFHTLAIRGSAGGYFFGEPRQQLLYALGGRTNLRGYKVDARLGKVRGVASAEWIHTLVPELDDNVFYFSWVSGLDGTLYADAAVVAEDWSSLRSAPPSADVGYGFRIFIDYFGVRPGIMAVDVAFPLYDVRGNPGFGAPAVYIDFTQSF